MKDTKYNSKQFNTLENYNGKENFFVSYAMRGEILVPGTRQGMPVNHPIPGPVPEPSPLNTRWIYSPGFSPIGVM